MKPVRVSIVGGGFAALAAAIELTQPEHDGRYAVTVYQMGWRLGGKAASGRGPAGRIEARGMQRLAGCDDNAFRLIRRCYTELGRDPAHCAIATWRDAFQPEPPIGEADWTAWFPAARGDPGDPRDADSPSSIASYLERAAAVVRELLGAFPDLRELAARFAEMIGPALADQGNVGQPVYDAIRVLAAASHAALTSERDPALRRRWQIVDLALAIVRGALRSGLAFDARGCALIDDHDWRDWLTANGASRAAVESGVVRAIYDLAFAYEDGDTARPALAAGVALRATMRAAFCYRGAPFWTARAGTGDVAFAPLYELLRRRGARFEFFHRLRNVRLAETAEAPHVAGLEFDVQARGRGDAYEPLVEVRGVACWPSAPRWSQLEDGERLEREGRDFESHADRGCVEQRVLAVRRDFDAVVLGVGLGAIPHACAELVAHSPRWRAMIANLKTVATQTMQLWLSETASQVGWTGPAASVSGFVEPFETTADLSHVAAMEAWPDAAPGAIGYFCGALADAGDRALDPDRAYEISQRERVAVAARRFVDHEIGAPWPRAVTADGFRWELLVAPPGDATQRLDGQCVRANTSPSDRSALSLPGTTRFRISPLDDTFDNLTIAGDWTRTGLDIGCIESAVVSGMLAAHAISGLPRLEAIVGYEPLPVAIES